MGENRDISHSVDLEKLLSEYSQDGSPPKVETRPSWRQRRISSHWVCSFSKIDTSILVVDFHGSPRGDKLDWERFLSDREQFLHETAFDGGHVELWMGGGGLISSMHVDVRHWFRRSLDFSVGRLWSLVLLGGCADLKSAFLNIGIDHPRLRTAFPMDWEEDLSSTVLCLRKGLAEKQAWFSSLEYDETAFLSESLWMKVSESGGPENLEWEGFGVLNQSVWLDVETWLEVFVKKERAKLKSDDDFSGKDLHMNFLTQKIGFASSIMRKRFEKLLDRLGVSASSRWGDMSGLSSGDYMDMVKLLRDDVDYLSTRLDASQRELSRERQRVSNAVEEKKTFIDVLRNELKASLNGMTSMLTLMKATELNDEQKEYATLATTASESMSGILSRLYDVVLLDSGHFEMKRDFLPLADVMKKIDGKWRSEVESRGLKFECRGLPEKDIVIDLDEERVLTLVDELMKNSVKKTAKGSIEIKCAIVEDHSHEMTLRFEVSDTGQGMEEDKVNLLFREFSKQELFGSRQFESMGIGLSLCHKLVHAMGGKMGVYSEIGKGSRFWFILKVKKFKEEVEDISPKSNEDVGGQDPHSTKGMEVLLIDDNPISRKVLVQQLERMGMNIEVSGSSFTGLELLQSQPYALLVLGMSMPDMNAFDLVLRLKESLSESDMKMPVILGLAKNPHADLRVKCLEVGMSGLLGKPLPSNDLKSFLSEHF